MESLMLRSLSAFLIVLFFAVSASADSDPCPLRVAVLGDSLTAGYGLPAGEAFPAQLEQALREKGFAVRVSNAGVSGDTSAGGLARLNWLLADRPELVIVELGANDALRGLPPQQVEENLDAILSRLQEEGVAAILAGMKAPRNLGEDYYSSFNAIYPRLAERYQVPLYAFFLAGVAGNPSLNQGDGMHPNARGVARIIEGCRPLVEETLRNLRPECAPDS